MKKAILIPVIILAMFFLSGCSYNKQKNQEPLTKNTLNVSVSVEPVSIDPAKCLSMDACSVLTNLFEGLVNFDKNGNFVPGVATSWVANEDYTKFTFYLRNNAQWSDGSNVTAEDFKYAWLRTLNPETASSFAYYLYYIKNAESYNAGRVDASQVGINVIDPYTLEVNLENPCSYFLSLTTLAGYYPIKSNIIKDHGDKWTQDVATYITNGAYKLKEWQHDTNLLIEKNNNYWDSNSVYIPNINFLLMADATTIINAYETGELDFIEYTLKPDEMAQIAEIKYADFVYTRLVEFNLNKEIFKDVRVREAINIALDRDNMVSLVGQGNFPMQYFIPSGFRMPDTGMDYREIYTNKYFESTPDIERANKLLAEAGYADGKGIPTLTYLCNTIGYNVANAEIFKNQLAKIGVDVKIVSLDKKIMVAQRNSGDYDFTPVNLLAEYPDISVFLYSLRTKDSSNYAHYSNVLYDDLYTKIITESDVKTKFELVNQAENILMKDYPVIPLYINQMSYIENGSVEGYTHDTAGRLSFVHAKIIKD
ncbi:MAG: peptide ABC transporter substrate-binding protein [Candidatus Cloacimonetes bacterium]|nr:peptide ABC transporter substrate-binding protein [Candidatus Cloacimonadota bacterium]